MLDCRLPVKAVLSRLAPRASRSGGSSTKSAFLGSPRGGGLSAMDCVDCGSAAVTERRDLTAQGYRRFRCRDCGKQFNERSDGVLNSPLTKSGCAIRLSANGLRRIRMALRRQRARQAEMLVTWSELLRSPGHVFYDRLLAILIRCRGASHYAIVRGRPPLLPHAADRLFRRHRQRTRPGMALCRQLLVTRVPAARRARDCAGSFLVEPHAFASAAGTARAGVHLRAAPPIRARSDRGRADRCGSLDDGGERCIAQHRATR
jgi:hypothetical protein